MKKIFFLVTIYFISLNSSYGLIEVDITRGNLDPLPIAVSPLHVDNNSEEQEDIKIKEVIKKLEQITKHKPEIIIQKKRIRPLDSEVNRLVGSNAKAKKLLKWKPRYHGLTGFEKSLLKTYQWYEKNQETYNDNFLQYNL